MFRLEGLQGGTSDLYTSRSGRQSQQNFKGVNSTLAEKAVTYQKCENSISQLAYLQLGLKTNDYDKVKYPTSFDTVALAEEIDGYLLIMVKNFSETLNKTLMKEMARKSVPLAPEVIRKQIEEEIDAGDGIVEENIMGGIQAEKDGDGNINTDQGDSFKTKDQKDKEDSSHERE